MDGKDIALEHLKIILAAIDRLGRNSFRAKNWSLGLIVTAIILIVIQGEHNAHLILLLILPVFGFWILDGYFLWQERLFRKVYDETRVQSDTDFKMNPLKHRGKPKCSWVSAIFSVTLVIFYLIEIVFIAIVFFIVDAKTPPTP